MNIYIRLGDEFFEKVFQEKFEGFIIEKNGHQFRLPTPVLLKLLKIQMNKFFEEEINKDDYIDKEIHKIENGIKKSGKQLKSLEKADKARDKVCGIGEKIQKKKGKA